MAQLDDHSRNRRGCFLILAIAVLGLAAFLFLYFNAPASERHNPLSNGEAPVTKSAPFG